MNYSKIGAIGGKSKSSKKRRASRRNGSKGGRTGSLSLAELLLRRSLSPNDRNAVDDVYQQDLFERERQVLQDVFHCDLHSTGVSRAATRNLEGEVAYVVKKFRLAASKLKLAKRRAPMEYIARDIHATAEWEARHPGGPPPPPIPRQIVFERLPFYKDVEATFAKNPRLTIWQIIEAVGSKATQQNAQLLLDHFRSVSKSRASAKKSE
jgi:hypothetical protein